MNNGFDPPEFCDYRRPHASMAMVVNWSEEFQRVWDQPAKQARNALEHAVWLPKEPSVAGQYVLVTIRNHAQLRAAYGREFFEALHWNISWQLHEWGATVVQIDQWRMLACLPVKASHARRGGTLAQVIASWQISLAARLFTFKGAQAVAVIGVDPVDTSVRRTEAESGQVSGQMLRVKRSSTDLADPQSGWRWRANYKADMSAAFAFFRALARHNICMALQPVVAMSHLNAQCHDPAPIPRDAVLYQEALVRCTTSTATSNLRPAVFVPALERLGLVHRLDHMVLEAMVLRLQEDVGLHLGCNVSAMSLAAHDEYWDGLLSRMRQLPDVAARLTIEITETSPLADDETVLTLVRELQALGCRIAIDDFGAGHIRLDVVRAIKPQVIKLDARMIERATESEEGFREFHCMANLAAAMAPVVVVEGVSGWAQRNAAQRAGMEWLQGVGVAEPSLAHPRIALSPPNVQEVIGQMVWHNR